MNKSKFIYIALLTLVFTFSACKSWLDLKPEDGLTRQDYWQTKEQVDAAVVGCYSTMQNNVEQFFVWGEIRADMLAPGTGIDAYNFSYRNIMHGDILSTYSICSWATTYKVINSCNLVLEFAKDAQSSDASFTDQKRRAFEAEALGMRALMYFYLARTFSDVPLVLEATYSDDQNFNVAKSPQADIIKQIQADLDTAQKYAVTTYGTVEKDKGRITKYAIWAMKADVYLWNEQYQLCSDYCDSITKSQNFGLLTTDQYFTGLFVNGNSTESIFELQFSQLKQNPFCNIMGTTAATGRVFKANQTLNDIYFPIDPDNPPVRETNDVRGYGASFNINDMSIWKYRGLDYDNQRDVNTQSYAHWIFYRYADILLLQAEAYAQLGLGQKALDIVNTIRVRGRALPTTAGAVSASNADQVTAYVLQERGRELAFEGKRWFDLLRTAKRKNYSNSQLLRTASEVNVPSDKIVSVDNKLKDARSLYLPISYYELLVNKSLVQNDFYTSSSK